MSSRRATVMSQLERGVNRAKISGSCLFIRFQCVSLLTAYYRIWPIANKIVITDRLHGMIFAAITNNPCVVLLSQSLKLKEFITSD